MKKDYYAEGIRYERLIRIAYNFKPSKGNGADKGFMRNAIWAENGASYVKHLGSYEKQLEKVKVFISKALIKLSNTKPYNNAGEYFLWLNSKVKNAYSTEELLYVIDKATDKAIELKEF